MKRWTLLYDADCGFCTWTVAVILRWDRDDRIVPKAIQDADEELSDLDPVTRLASMHLISPAGERTSAGPALVPLLELLPGGTLPARLLARLPRLTSRGYDLVADHRTQISKAVPAKAKRRASARVHSAEADRVRP